ncbi:MAG: DUF885 domain-containing protein [Deltaproteobacteria bacterium]|nr:DUF885 domain-containing protein [Deltaproteobacteria bacterium]
MRNQIALTLAVLLAFAAGCSLFEPSPSARLEKLVESHFDSVLELNPTFATALGDHRYDDRLANDIGPEHRRESLALAERSLAAAREIPRDALSGQDLLSYDAFVLQLELAIEGASHPQHLLPISQMFSTPNYFAQMGSGASVHPFRSVQDYDNFRARMGDFSTWVDQAIANLREGMERGIVHPRVVVEKALPQIEAHAGEDLSQSIFRRPLAKLPEGLSGAEASALTQRYEASIREVAAPAYARLRDFIRGEYLPAARKTVGLGELPGGQGWYAFRLRETTTMGLSADEIHELGLREVERIRAELRGLAAELGAPGELPAFYESLRGDSRFHFESEEALLEAYRSLEKRVDAELPKLFRRIPEAQFEIRPVEAFRAASHAAASYMRPAPDGSRPGIFYVNTYDLAARPSYQVEAIYLHEAMPGHHFQIALAQEVKGLPRFRRYGGNTAYIEGWGLYAETLGAELGMFRDPYQRIGALVNEMWRACRLVVDTGLHAQGWSRERAMDYMLANAPLSRTDVVAEVERYIAMPSQAVAYKIGQLKFSELRQRAADALGPRFDLRDFHAALLEDGPLPLAVLESKLEDWIRARSS